MWELSPQRNSLWRFLRFTSTFKTFKRPSMKLKWTLCSPWMMMLRRTFAGPFSNVKWLSFYLDLSNKRKLFGFYPKRSVLFCWDIFCIILWNWHLMLCCCFLLLFPASAVIGEKGVWKFRWYHIKSLRNTNEIRVHYFQREKKTASIFFRKLF